MKEYFGKFRGHVVDNKDPKKIGRLKLRIPEVLGSHAVSPWAWPCVPFAFADGGFLFIPPVDAGVWVEFEAGDVNRPIWTGCWWAGSTKPEDGIPQVPSEGRTGDYPKICVLKVPDGAKVVFQLVGDGKIYLGGETGARRVARKGDGVTGDNTITGGSTKIFAVD